MEYLRKILRQILKEEAAQDDIMDAIKKKYEVVIKYDSGGARVIEPAVYGTSSAGNMVLRAYQTNGYTKTHVPAWKEFIVDKIDDWKPNKDKTFDEPPSFNKSGAGLSNVFVTSDFEGENAMPTDNELSGRKNIEIGGGNKSSLEDMSRANNFGDDQSDYTSGPVKKGNSETNNVTQQKPKVNYGNIAKNGPVFKGEEEYKEPTQEFVNKEHKAEKEDNHEEPDIDFEKEMEKETENEQSQESEDNEKNKEEI